VFVNTHVSHDTAVARFRSFDSDVVVSTEMVCYTGDYCKELNIGLYYSQLNRTTIASPSPYVSSQMSV